MTVWDSLSIKKPYQWHGWVTHARIDENPGIRGHDLCFDKTCQGNRLAKRAKVEGQIKKLRKVGYLSDDTAHRLPDEGQLIPTPRPHERVVFLTHFLRGLGFPLVTPG